jgi:cytochrome c oxidase assembly factor CtaG
MYFIGTVIWTHVFLFFIFHFLFSIFYFFTMIESDIKFHKVSSINRIWLIILYIKYHSIIEKIIMNYPHELSS